MSLLRAILSRDLVDIGIMVDVHIVIHITPFRIKPCQEQDFCCEL
jgi:hypothetical protein